MHQHHRIDRFQQIGDLFRLREIELGILDVIFREPVEREQQLLCGMGAVPEDRDLRRLPRIVKAVGDVVECGKIRHPAQQRFPHLRKGLAVIAEQPAERIIGLLR